ncbi:MAG: glutathione-regulated potassium-efflux system protein, partial [Phenylobacterium sp.]|nr:glutathione-regulated potassium-efflux system protein [Phenylobacterium sp.]
PPILGYLAAGFALGPHALGLEGVTDQTRFLAELGVIFLMFTVGLEFSLPTMFAARSDVFGAGALQVALTALGAAGVAAMLGAAPVTAFLIGGAVAMSSTAVVLKQLAEQGDLGTRAGRLTVGLLLFQDLATLPFLVVIGAYAGDGDLQPMALAGQVAVGGLTLAAAAVIGRPLFRGALAWVAGSQSAELFLLAVLLLALGAAWIAGLAGLAAPLGAFMAGVIVGESDFRHHVEDDVRPFRDVLLGLFFVTVGMGLDLRAASEAPLAVAGWLLVFLTFKPAVVLLIGRLRRWSRDDSVRTALAMANGGEFGLLLVTQGLAVRLLPTQLASPLLIALVVSMGLAPILTARAADVARRFAGQQPAQEDAEIAAATQDLTGHVILCGCGRIGRPVAAALDAAKLPYIALEKDFTRFRAAQAQGLRAMFADAGRGGMLAAAGLARARLVVLTFLNEREAEPILRRTRTDAPKVVRLANALDEDAAKRLLAAGADTVFPENLAAGLGLAHQALLLCGLDQASAARVITELRGRLSPALITGAGV